MKKNKTKIFIAIIAVLVLTLTVVTTSINDFIGLTGIYNISFPEHIEREVVDPEKDYYLQEMNDGVYYLTGWSHSTMFVVTQESVVVVDAIPGLGEKYLSAIKEVTDKPISHVIYSHSHTDHIGRADIFGDNVTIISHKITADILREKNDPLRPIPDVTFEDEYVLEVGGKVIELKYHGPAHSPGNIAIYLPNEKVLAMIDVAFPKWIPLHEFAIAENLDAYFQVFDSLLAYDFEYFVGGHANLGNYKDVLDQRDYVFDVKETAARIMKSIGIEKLGKRAGETNNPFVVVKFGLDRAACKCNDEIIERWSDKLASVDVFTYENCKRMLFYTLAEE